MENDTQKILIWNTFPLKARSGGPTTYLYNLEKSVALNGLQERIHFAHDYEVSIPKQKSALSLFFKEKVKPGIQYFLKDLTKIDTLFRWLTNKNEKEALKKEQANAAWKQGVLDMLFVAKESVPAHIDLNAYAYIHFHSTFEYYACRNLLKEYRGEILLTSHAPKAVHKEIVEDWFYGHTITEEQLAAIIAIDHFAFENADHVIFPCDEAQEPYFNSWEAYKSLPFKNERREFLTCTEPSVFKRSKKEILSEYNIPEDAFIITYFGRHNEVKGYDLLRELGKELLEASEKVYFLVAGKEDPLAGLSHKRWIEVGWTTDPHSLVNAADLFILPNRETYFDLALLEVLSVGTRCLISETGGNRYFKKLTAEETSGIHYFKANDVADLIKQTKAIIANTPEQNANKVLFDTYFHNDVFAKSYIELIKKLKSE